MSQIQNQIFLTLNCKVSLCYCASRLVSTQRHVMHFSRLTQAISLPFVSFVAVLRKFTVFNSIQKPLRRFSKLSYIKRRFGDSEFCKRSNGVVSKNSICPLSVDLYWTPCHIQSSCLPLTSRLPFFPQLLMASDVDEVILFKSYCTCTPEN